MPPRLNSNSTSTSTSASASASRSVSDEFIVSIPGSPRSVALSARPPGHQNLRFWQFLRLMGYVAANAALLIFNITHLQVRIRELYYHHLNVSLQVLKNFFVPPRVIGTFCSRRKTVLNTSAPKNAEIYGKVLHPNKKGSAGTWEELSKKQKFADIAIRLLFPFDYMSYFYNAAVASYILMDDLVYGFFKHVLGFIPSSSHEKMMDVMFNTRWNTANHREINWLVRAELTPAVTLALPLTIFCAYLISSTYKRYKLNRDARVGFLRLMGDRFSKKDLLKLLPFGLALAAGVAFSANFTSQKTLEVTEDLFPFIGKLGLAGKQGWLPWFVLVASFVDTFSYSLDSSIKCFNRFAPKKWAIKEKLPESDEVETVENDEATQAETVSSQPAVNKNHWTGEDVFAGFLKFFSFIGVVAGLIDMMVGKQLIVAPLSFFDFIYGATQHKELVPLPPKASNWDSPTNVFIYLAAIYLVFGGMFPKLDYNLLKLGDGVKAHLWQLRDMIGWVSDKVTSCRGSQTSEKRGEQAPLLSDQRSYNTLDSDESVQAVNSDEGEAPASGCSAWCAWFATKLGLGASSQAAPAFPAH